MSNGTNFILDLTGYKDRVGARVEPGRYRVVVDDAEMDKSKAGNPMVNIWLRVVGGEFDGATLTDRLTITDKALFRIVGFMQAIGLPTPKKRLQVNTAMFVGKMLDVDVEDGDPYNGRIKSEVRGYLRVAAGQQSSADDLPDPSDDLTVGVDPEATPAGLGEPAPLSAVPDAPEASESAPEEVDLATLDLG